MIHEKYRDRRYGMIKNDTYSHHISTIKAMVKLAKKDFPGLKDDDIEVIIFGPPFWEDQLGIKFTIPKGAKFPTDYLKMDFRYLL